MGVKWDSVIFRRGDLSPAKVAEAAVGIPSMCVDPIQVQLHLMQDRPTGELWSGELTALRRRPLVLRSADSTLLSAAVFGDSGFLFAAPEVALAHRISELGYSDTVYIHANDTYNSLGFVCFSAGSIGPFVVAGWEGSQRTFASDPELLSLIDPGVLLGRGLVSLGWESAGLYPEDLFDIFYAEDCTHYSFQLVEDRRRVVPPRRL